MIPATGTTVTYPSGATTSTGTVLHVADAGEGRSAAGHCSFRRGQG